MSRDVGKASHNLRFGVRVLRLHEKISPEVSISLLRILELNFSVETSTLHILNYLVF